jgi:hypothetical protein
MFVLEKIELDDKKIQESELPNIHLLNPGILKITLKAKNTHTNEGAVRAKINIKKDTLQEKTKIEKLEIDIMEKVEPLHPAIKNTHYNSNINNLLSFEGKGLKNIAFVGIGEKSLRPVYSSGNLFVQIDHDMFASGEYFVFFTLKNGKIITSEIKLTFNHSDFTINIANITPSVIRNINDNFLVIQGNGFDKIISVQLSNNLILKNAEFQVINDQVA